MGEEHSDPFDILLRRLEPAHLPDAVRHAVRKLPAAVRDFRPNQDVVHEGGPSTHCCIVLTGWVGCYQMLEGRRQIVAIHIPGDTPDLQSLHLPEPDFGMQTMTVASMAFIPHTDIQRLIAAFPFLGAVLWRETLLVAAIHRAWMTGLGRRNSLGRLAHLFCELYLRLEAIGLADAYSMPMPLRQYDLADALGQTTVHINRTLQDMRRAGLIELEGRQLMIKDWQRLVAAAEFNPLYLHLSPKVAEL